VGQALVNVNSVQLIPVILIYSLPYRLGVDNGTVFGFLAAWGLPHGLLFMNGFHRLLQSGLGLINRKILSLGHLNFGLHITWVWRYGGRPINSQLLCISRHWLWADHFIIGFIFKIKNRFFNQVLRVVGHSNNPPQQQALNVVCNASFRLMKNTFPIIVLFLASCADNQQAKISGPDTLMRLMADTSNNAAKIEYEIYKSKKEMCKRLCIYDLESGTDSFELRLWQEPSMWEPHELFILKGIDTSWLMYHYVYYQRHNNYETNADKAWDAFHNPRIDSVSVKTLRPQKMSWTNYLNNLQIDSIWNYISQSEVKKYRGGVDGQSYSLEIADKSRYKFIHYNNPEFETVDPNHTNFVAFMNKLISPLFDQINSQ